jgi:hypothetical protein
MPAPSDEPGSPARMLAGIVGSPDLKRALRAASWFCVGPGVWAASPTVPHLMFFSNLHHAVGGRRKASRLSELSSGGGRRKCGCHPASGEWRYLARS